VNLNYVIYRTEQTIVQSMTPASFSIFSGVA